MKLSIIMPVFNEARTIAEAVTSVESINAGVEKELVIVDDASTDGTRDIISGLCAARPGLKLVVHEKNRGKGAALRTGFAAATGDVIVVQDADLEYDPKDYRALLAPILDGHADVVFGSRFVGGGAHRVCFFWHYMGNRVITACSNMMTNLNLSDVEVGYKMFRKEVLDSVSLKENRFGFEIEITAKIARAQRWRIYEVPVSYYGRSYAQGKKITWRDGVHAMWCILKYRFA